MFDVSIALNRSKNVREVLRQILEMMARYMGLERGTLTLLDKNSSEIFIEEALGMTPEEKARGKYKIGEGIIGKVVESGMSVFIPRISDEPQFVDKTKARDKISMKDVSFLCVPIKYDNEVIGTLSVDRVFNNNISFEEDIRLLTIIGGMIAQTLRARQEEHEEVKRLQEENARLQSELKMKFNPATMIGNGEVMQQVYRLIARAAPTSVTVLLTGESGVGKELVAKTIHMNSRRASGRFVEVICSAIPPNAIEAELFGLETLNEQKKTEIRHGKIEQAEGGTLFLDDIADLSLSAQNRLLALLEQGVIQRVGGVQTKRVNVRLLAATGKNLERMVEEGTFTEALYYHLHKYPIHIPPLRERKSDIPQLIDHFIERFNKLHNLQVKRIATSAIDMIMAYHWPGNVRELESCVERACVISNTGVIYGFHLPPTLQTPESTVAPERGPLQTILAKVERELIQDNLKLTRGDIGKAAENLGITERMIAQRIAKYGIDTDKFKMMR